ncbi:DNA-binding transcriptional regulator, MocR family, contains an aminotransferase domain [Pedococcus dokdonensis]|uniref:DNA-binding transcriptional regulator, MocR family, contains an aminotransferase domain n=1 Tax=Pedococcus dokdonensis TaxID=443156 RepID=A0A1H0QGV4_9MICO|nr:PLP-dependent aminotransferase family protein [Pedococcus dokdonensis]SDP16621.1 DNA-binding transcriptional regulator, MocR family, contains an aminotransferase domain [Pedococcus dokdonensis]
MPARTISATRLVPMLGAALDTAPAYRGLADAVRLLVADGRIPVGTRLPSERDLTATLGVSRTTVTRAYAELRDRGYLTSRQGSGSVVALPGDPAGRRQASALHPTAEPGDGAVIDLTCASMSAPAGTVAAYERAVAELPRYLAGTGYHPLGLMALREALAQRFTERGLATTPDQVMVTSGALAGLAVTARALLSPGDRVLLESPTYPNAIETLRRSGARAVGLPLDRGGWDLGAADAALRQTAPRAAYLIPDFHNPTGALMPDAQRAELGAALAGTHTVGVVDETLVDLAHDPAIAMPRPLAAHHPRTVTLGGASKTFWGGLRVGWIRAPRELMPALVGARLTLDLGAPVLEQLVLTDLLAHREEVVADRRTAIVSTRDALIAALRDRLPQWRFRVPEGGLCLWVELPDALSTPLCAAADQRGVVLAPGSQFAVEGGMERYLRLPFTGHPPEVVEDAVERLALAWGDAQSARPTRHGGSPLVA